MKTVKKRQSSPPRQKRKSYKHRATKVQGEILCKKEGWIKIHIYGEPFERGFAHGSLLHAELQRVYSIFPFIIKEQFHTTYSTYMNVCVLQIKPVLMNKYPEFYRELMGISEGAKSKGGTQITVDFLIAWNATLSLYSYFGKTNVYRCCAFIATGKHTEKGRIVMAHNTHCDFVSAQVFNIIMKITPSSGGEFVMQTAAGYIASGTDWFICKNGMVGCETTISNMSRKPSFGEPYFCRIRQAMQYANSLDEYVNMMLHENAGDYSCSWLFGDINTNEIMRFEIGVKTHSIEKTRDGAFFGMNSAMDSRFRNIETNDTKHYQLVSSVGSRNYRLNTLLNETYRRKINVTNAKQILSDHFDVYLNREQMNSRNICKHTEMDSEITTRKKNYPFGCVDGKVVDTRLAKRMQFLGRFGSSCGRVFNAKEFLKEHPEYEKSMGKYLVSFPRKEWVLL